jgi:hypothetical protein
MRPIRQGSVVWLACLWWSGCAHTASVTYWRPAELDVPGLHRLAVAPFAGDHGHEIAQLLESRLWDEGSYSVADHSDLGPAILAAGFPQDDIDHPSNWLSAARSAGIDGIIVGEVLEFGVVTAKSNWAGTSSQPMNDAPQRGAPVRTARVELALRLIDVQTGEVCSHRQIRREAAPGGSGGRPAAEQQLLTDLARDCLEEFMGDLTPRPATAEIQLAAGEWFWRSRRELQHGIRLARQGQWDRAATAWERVLDRDPANHAALYNLAVAAAQHQDFVAAEDYAMQALRAHHTDCYARGLDQLRQFRAEADRIARQRQAQVIQASLTALQP